MSELSRKLMMKKGRDPKNTSSNCHSKPVAPGLQRGTALKAAYEAANYPTNFVAVESDFDNPIIITCPPMPEQPKKPESKNSPVLPRPNVAEQVGNRSNERRRSPASSSAGLSVLDQFLPMSNERSRSPAGSSSSSRSNVVEQFQPRNYGNRNSPASSASSRSNVVEQFQPRNYESGRLAGSTSSRWSVVEEYNRTGSVGASGSTRTGSTLTPEMRRQFEESPTYYARIPDSLYDNHYIITTPPVPAPKNPRNESNKKK